MAEKGMATAATPISTIEEWKRAMAEFSNQSIDTLAPVISKVFDAAWIILKNSDPCHIQMALESLDNERKLRLRYEKSERTSTCTTTRPRRRSNSVASSTSSMASSSPSSTMRTILARDVRKIITNLALRKIEFEYSRNENLTFAIKKGEPLIRSLSFGIIESLHLTLTYLTEEKKDGYEKAVATINEWKKKCYEFSAESFDALSTLLSRGFDSLFIIIKNADICHIRRALGTLDFDRLQSLRYENIEELSIRSLMFGMIESLHLTLLHLIDKKNLSNSTEEVPIEQESHPISASINSSGMDSTQSLDQLSTIPTFTTSFHFDSKEEPVEISRSITVNDVKPLGEVIKDEPIDIPQLEQPFGLDFIGDEIKEEETLNDDLKEPKEELFDAPLSDVGQQFSLNFIDEFKDEPILDEGMGNDFGNVDSMGGEMIENGVADEETVEDLDNIPNGSSEDAEVSKRRRSSTIVSGNVKNTESADESDGEMGPTAKKRRSEVKVERRDKTGHQKGMPSSKGDSLSEIVKKNMEDLTGYTTVNNELECPECEYRSISVGAWQKHLKRNHSTTPALAGCLLRCDCGHESYSDGHVRECEIANFTIIRNGDAPIRRLTDKPVTPKCVLCEMYPKTACGYAAHLQKNHKSTLKSNGIYLICSCGTRYRYNGNRDYKKHDKKCSGREFTLHKLDED